MLAACFGKSFKTRHSKRNVGVKQESKDVTSPPQSGATVLQRDEHNLTAEQPREEAPGNDKRGGSATEHQQGVSFQAAGLNAVRIQDVQPESVAFCNPRDILDGVQLTPQELGRGTYGVVVTGSYRGVSCAIKVMLSQQQQQEGDLDRASLREVLLGPRLVHPNLVSTFASRCAPLTDDFFDFLEGPRMPQDRGAIQGGPRALEPAPLNSGDGFGDPGGMDFGMDPMTVLHHLLVVLQARTGQAMVVTVQQFCDKGTLDNTVRKGVFRDGGPRWPERVAIRALIRTAAEMARGLLHLHDANVIHGDLKPANVLLHTNDGDARGFIVKVADFGLSHVLPSAANSMFTSTWGSVAYMAPEAFDGKVSRVTDVWAFGVVLWEMLTGMRPYMGMTIPEVVKGVKEDSLPLKWPLPNNLTCGIINLGRSCMQHDPEARPDFKVVLEKLVEIERAIREQALAQAAAKVTTVVAAPKPVAAAAAGSAGPGQSAVAKAVATEQPVDPDEGYILAESGVDMTWPGLQTITASMGILGSSAGSIPVAGPLPAAAGGAVARLPAAALQIGSVRAPAPGGDAAGSGGYL